MALLPVSDDRGTPSKMCAPMVKTEHLKMQDYFMQIYDSHRQDYLKMAEALFFIKRDFFLMSQIKQKEKEHRGRCRGNITY